MMLDLSKILVSKLPAIFATSIITPTSKQDKSKKKVPDGKKSEQAQKKMKLSIINFIPFVIHLW